MHSFAAHSLRQSPDGSLAAITASRAVVAAKLVLAQRDVDDVAADLAAAHERADATSASSNPGEAADAASRSPEPGPKP